jgi:two-component system, chemotaxis family, chemotaxis protein CheY
MKTENILVVDDSISMKQMITFTLTSDGYNIVEAVNGEDAVELIENSEYIFDCVITDINMPVMDGFELTEYIRTKVEYNGVPILVLTTEASDEHKLKGKNAGATGWMVKPFSPDKLNHSVHKVCDIKD